MKRLENRCALVTGGATGIGRASAIRLAEEGARILIGDIRDEEAQQTVDLIREAGGTAEAVHCDTSNEDQVEAMTTRAAELYGGPHILVASAGTSSRSPFHQLSLADWERIIRINLTGTFLCCRAAVRRMLEAGGGSIVTIGSIQSLIISGPGAASYKASKGGILMLTRCIAAEYGDDNIRANCVCPGGVNTEMVDHIEEESAQWTSRTTHQTRTYSLDPPIRRFAEPEEIASVVAFLASDDSSFITGSAVMADGGYTAI